jgi:hypothetical protein
MGGMNMTPEQRQKFQEAREKLLNGRNMRELPPEEMQKIMQEAFKAAGVEAPAGGFPFGGGAGRRGQGGGENAAGGEGGGRRGGEGRGGGRGGDGPPTLGFSRPGQFTEKDLENAKLPPPPEEDTQFEVLLRPGLLADVEIIVEKIPNALHVPMQAVYEKDGKPTVYVKKETQFEARAIKPLKRSESTMVIAEGVKEGEVVALSDPSAKKGQGKKKDKGSGGAMGALGGGNK